MEHYLKELLSVIKHSLHQKVYKEPISDEQAFYVAAFENGLIGLIHEHLAKEAITERLFKRLQVASYAYVASDVLQMNIIERAKKLLNENQIKHIFLKGSHLKFIYPKSYMRAMGDIDILVERKEMKKVHDILSEASIVLSSRSSAHDLYKTPEDITIEIHPALYKKTDLIFQKDDLDPWAYSKLIDAFTYALDPTYELIYLLYHLSKHIKTSGVGLRSILDIGVYLETYHHVIDFEKLDHLLSASELNTFFNTITSFNEYYFGFTFPFEFKHTTLTEARMEALLLFFTRSGIHGKGHTFNQFESRIVSHQQMKKSKFSFYISLFFPSYHIMKDIYPLLNRCPILLPLFWIYRLMMKLTKGIKTSLVQTKKALIKKKTIDDTRVIFKDLGL